MTREEALRWFEKNIRAVSMPGARAAHEAAIRALRPVSGEQVEKVWRGEWKMEEAQEFRCSACGAKITYYGHPDKFCADCGSAMTDEAVQMVMERLEELYEIRD